MISMTLKQFLKPDWRKIALTIIIFSIISYFVTFPLMEKPPCMISRCPTAYVSRQTLPQHVCGVCIEDVKSNDYLIGTIIYLASPSLLTYNLGTFDFFVLEFIFWYLLSCLIVWIYDKFRKKK